MTLTELKYVVALARESHFGRAAQSCHVSQPTLSLAIKKLEEELNAKLFERAANDVFVTEVGKAVVNQAQVVLEQADRIRDIVQTDQSASNPALTLGIIYTIAPYLLPDLIRETLHSNPKIPLILQENFTITLLELLRSGELDCAILAEPFPDAGLATAPLYDEPFWAAVPQDHAFVGRKWVSSAALQGQTMLLLGNGHCFRDHVLAVCPEFAQSSSAVYAARNDAHAMFRKRFEGSSLETIKHMVAAGLGVTLVPRLSVPEDAGASEHVHYIPVVDAQGAPPVRRVVLVWRRSFTRYHTIAALRNAIYACALPGVKRLT